MSTNGNGAVKAIATAATQLVTALPPSFLALLVVNAIFIGCLFWFEAHQTTARAQVLEHLITACEADLAKGAK